MGRRDELTVAGQQMRTSYLLPSSRPRSRYQDSRPRGTDSVGNCTGTRIGRIVSAGDKRCKPKSCNLERTLGRVTGLGPRNIVFSTLAFTVQACVTMQSSPAERRIFGGQDVRMGGSCKGGNSWSVTWARAVPLRCWRYRWSEVVVCLRNGQAAAFDVLLSALVRARPRLHTLKVRFHRQHQHLSPTAPLPPTAAPQPRPGTPETAFRYPNYYSALNSQ
jgi:hypothetical protein